MDMSREANMREQPMWLSATIPLGARTSRFCTGGPCVTRLGPIQEVAVALQPTAVVVECALKEQRTQLLAAELGSSPNCVGNESSAPAQPERKPLVRGCPGQSVRSSTTPKTKGGGELWRLKAWRGLLWMSLAQLPRHGGELLASALQNRRSAALFR